MKKRILLAAALLLSLLISSAQGQTNREPLADQLEGMLKTEPFRVGILLQSLGNFSLNNDYFNGGRGFRLGATRLSFQGNIDSGYFYKLQLDFRRAPSVLDAQVGYIFSDQFRLAAGAYKPWLSADLDPNPGATDFISRARLVGAMMNSREIGITALGSGSRLNYRIGIYNGNGLRNSGNDGRFLYTLRLGYGIDTENGRVTLGLNGGLNTSRMEAFGNAGYTSRKDRKLYGLFGKYDGEKWFGTAEFLQTVFEPADAPGDDETITGYYATLGHRASEKDEILFRWDHLSYDIFPESSELLILGWNHQATQLISFQVNVLARIADERHDEEQFGLAGNFQFQF